MSLWSGGRFDDGPADALWRFTVDGSDRRLLEVDVLGSIAHVTMLGEVDLVSGDDVDSLLGGLHRILAEARDGDFPWEDGDEDVHSAVERRLGELVGKVAGKLHTGRSRNDQVALDLRLYLLASIGDRVTQIERFIETLIEQGVAVGDAIVPSYTHVQQAQAVPFAHHLLAYAWMLVRDRDRFEGLRSRMAVSPLGAGASGGSSLPLDTSRSAELLGMNGAFTNSMDAVGSRDLVAEFAWCATQTMVHLSRLSEELILWCSSEFSWATYADAFTTGSSAMPQKKNPDIAELVRGRSAVAIGDLMAILTMQKGLPLTYNRDFQEDKRAVFHVDDVLAGSLDALTGLVATAEFHPEEPDVWVTSLDLAEALVARGVPFREAHHVVGRLVSTLVSEGRTFPDVTAVELCAFDDRFEPQDLERLDTANSIGARRSAGGGSMVSVGRQISELRTLLGSS